MDNTVVNVKDADYNHIIGANIRYERHQRKFTIEQLAYFLDISPSSLGLMERGQRGTNIKNLCKIADFFSITLDTLIRRKFDENGKILNEIKEKNIELDEKIIEVESLIENLSPGELDFVMSVIKELVKFRKRDKDIEYDF